MDTSGITLIERDMRKDEFARMNEGFLEHSIAHGAPGETPHRFGFVALQGPIFVGCSSGLAYDIGGRYRAWFQLTDLFVEPPHRGRVKRIFTWTAGYEAPGFYKAQGYDVFAELEDWYENGHSRIGLQKKVRSPPL